VAFSDKTGILHEDLSLNNIIHRIVEGEVHGVLINYDLPSWKAAPIADYAKSSQVVVRTPPVWGKNYWGNASGTQGFTLPLPSMGKAEKYKSTYL